MTHPKKPLVPSSGAGAHHGSPKQSEGAQSADPIQVGAVPEPTASEAAAVVDLGEVSSPKGKYPDPFKAPSQEPWGQNHHLAMRFPHSDHERAVSLLMQGFVMYAKAHDKRFESPIGEDYVLGPNLEEIARGLRGLLNGETGRLDCGTLDSMILKTCSAAGLENVE